MDAQPAEESQTNTPAAPHEPIDYTRALSSRSSRRFWLMVGIQAIFVFGLLASAVIMNLTIAQYEERKTELSLYRARLNEVHLDLLAMQSSLRGFVATDETLLLNSYQEALPRLEAQLQFLINQAVLNPERKASLNQLRIDVAQWQITYAEQAIAKMQQGNVAAAESLLAQSQPITENLLNRTQDIRLQLVSRSDQLTEIIRLLDILLMITVVVLAVLLLISTFLLMRFWRNQNSLLQELHAISTNLQQRNTDLRKSVQAQADTNRRLNARIEESRLINQINEMMVATNEPQYLFQQVALRIGTMLNGWCSILLEREPYSQELEWYGLYYPDPEKLEFIQNHVFTQAPPTKIEGLHAPLFTEDMSSIMLLEVPREIRHPEDLPTELQQLAEAVNLRSYMAVPIVIKDHPIGFISVASSITDYHFEPEQELFLEHLADRMSVWIERMELLNLAEQRALELQISFDNIPDSIITYDEKGRIIRINQTAQAFFGSREQALAKNWRTVTGQKLAYEEYPHIRAVNGEHVRDEELYIVRADGNPVIHAISAEPILSPNQHISGVVLVARDITNRKELERLKDEFLANMSHELRTPLTAILGYSELLLRRRTEALTHWHTSKVEGIRTGGQRLLNLVNDLLDVAKLEAGQITLEFHEHHINDIVLAQYELLKPQFQEKNIRFQKEFAPAIPAIRVDNERMNQVVLNLLSNAIKFTPEHGTITAATGLVEQKSDQLIWKSPVLNLDIPHVTAGEYVVVMISDTGIGISPEALPHLWDRFYQVEGGAARRFGGTGLGLSIVQQLIALHAGVIWATSSGENQGSMFAFLIPTSIQAPTEALPIIQGPTILVIEDDQATANIYEHHLYEAGYNVVHARDKAQALKFAPVTHPAAIILDLVLPDSTGWDILDELRKFQHLAHVPVIIASMFDQSPQFLKHTYSTFLVKPIPGPALINQIKTLIDEERRTHGYVLVVDDDPAMADLLRTTLEEHGYAVQTALDGGLALDILQTQQLPNLILLDLMMPIVDGFQLLARIRTDQRTAHVPVLIITARDLSNEELYKLRTTSQGIQSKHQLNIDTLVAEVQRHVPIQEESSNAGSDDLARRG